MSRPRICWFVITAIMCSAGGIRLAGQGVLSETEKRPAVEKAIDDFHTFGPRFGVGLTPLTAPLSGKPFLADYEEIHTRKSTNEVLRSWGSLAQDSAGRRREDSFSADLEHPSTTLHVTVIWDPATMTYYFLDHGSKEVQKIELGRLMQQGPTAKLMPEGMPPESPLPAPAEHERSIRVLGEKLIEGVLCHGSLYTYEPEDKRTEQWFSDRLSHPVLETTREKDLEIVYRLANIQLAEPSSNLFVVPPGYKELPGPEMGPVNP